MKTEQGAAECKCEPEHGFAWHPDCPTHGDKAAADKAQEWTMQQVPGTDDYHIVISGTLEIVATVKELSAMSITRCHNAALCEAKAAGWISQEALDEYAKVEAEHWELQQQLAAEREKRRIDLEHILDLDRTNQQLREQLAPERDKANVRETELICERDYFKKELEAARLLK